MSSRSLSPLLLLLLGGPLPVEAQDLTELARRARDSVVVLSVFDELGREVGTGTGFFVDGGYLVTNHHVVEPARRVEARRADAPDLAIVGILAVDQEHDLAILKPEAAGPPLPLAQRSRVEPGEQIVVLGNPLGLSGTLSEGIVSAVRERGVEGGGRSGFAGPLIQISAAISPGSSGSPVMSLQGEVVGVAMGQYLAGQNLNFAIPVSELRRLLARVDPDRLEASFGERRAAGGGAYVRNVLVSLAFFAAILFGLRQLRRAEGPR